MNADEVKQQIQELEKLRLQTRRFRLCTILALVAIVVVGVTAIINSVHSLTIPGPRQEVFLKELGGNLQRDVIPAVRKIATQTLERLKPALEVEFHRLGARAPQMADAALRELNRMMVDLPLRAEKTLDRTLGKTILQRQEKLRKMFPGVYDKQLTTLLNNMALEVEDQCGHVGEKIFRSHLNSIQQILLDLEKIQKSEAIDPQKQVDPWQTAFLFIDLFDQEFKDLALPDKPQNKEIKK